MCKLAYVRTTDGSAYNKCIMMIEHQEHRVGGHSTGFSFRTSSGFSTRKAIGKVNSYLEKIGSHLFNRSYWIALSPTFILISYFGLSYNRPFDIISFTISGFLMLLAYYLSFLVLDDRFKGAIKAVFTRHVFMRPWTRKSA